jgi:hypothetical protein
MLASKKFWTLLSRGFGFAALAIWIGFFYFLHLYFDSGSKQPDLSTGHVIPLNNHGTVHYITSQQDSRITMMQTVTFALFAVGFLINEFVVRPPKPKPWEKKQF